MATPTGGAGAQGAARRSAPAPKAAPPAAPRPVVGPTSALSLAGALTASLARGPRSGTWGVMVVSLTRGDTLYARNAGRPLRPASTMKLWTAALALGQLGPDRRLGTTVLRDGRVDAAGTLHGHLVLRGIGDPALSERFIGGGPTGALDALAEGVARRGIRHVTGDVVGDGTTFESRRIPEGWKTTYLHLAYAAPVSALSLNENVVTVVVTPTRAGSPPEVSYAPEADGYPLRNRATTRAGAGGSLTVVRHPEGGMEVRGWIGQTSATRRYRVVVPDPDRFTTGAFAAALRRRGVTVGGRLRLGTTPDSAWPISVIPSPPLSRLVTIMNRESDNHYAELLFRNAARGTHGWQLGSAEVGNRALRTIATRMLDVPDTAVTAADGSGLSLSNRVTPRAMVRLLDHAHRAPWSSEFHASLPVAGESGSLRNRMRGTPAAGNLHAKTGTTNEALALAGYTTAANGEIIAFAFLYNGADRWSARTAIDAMSVSLTNLARP